MGRVLSERDGPTFGLVSSLDMYKKLLKNASRLRDGWCVYDATDFTMVAWHLFHDWVKSDSKEALSRQKRNRNALPPQMILVLDVIRDLANGSKHFKLDNAAAEKRKVGEVHSGLEASYFSYFFHEDLPAVSTDEGWYFSIRVLHNILLSYYQWVFDDSKAVRDFPQEITDTIDYCNIRTRQSSGTVPPKLWGQYEGK